MTNKFIIILGICLGMEHLHSKNIIHRDLKPGNVLLDQNFYPKICDFNLSKTASLSQKCSTFLGTIEYCAPEVLKSDSEEKYNGKKADVYSFGMTLYSIIYDSNPFSNISNRTKILFDIVGGMRPELNDDEEFKPFNELIKNCWDNNPDKRPEFKIIKNILNEIKKKFVTSRNIETKKVNDFLEEIKKCLKTKSNSSKSDIQMIETLQNTDSISEDIRKSEQDFESKYSNSFEFHWDRNFTKLHYAAMSNSQRFMNFDEFFCCLNFTPIDENKNANFEKII